MVAKNKCVFRTRPIPHTITTGLRGLLLCAQILWNRQRRALANRIQVGRNRR